MSDAHLKTYQLTLHLFMMACQQQKDLAHPEKHSSL